MPAEPRIAMSTLSSAATSVADRLSSTMMAVFTPDTLAANGSTHDRVPSTPTRPAPLDAGLSERCRTTKKPTTR